MEILEETWQAASASRNFDIELQYFSHKIDFD